MGNLSVFPWNAQSEHPDYQMLHPQNRYWLNHARNDFFKIEEGFNRAEYKIFNFLMVLHQLIRSAIQCHVLSLRQNRHEATHPGRCVFATNPMCQFQNQGAPYGQSGCQEFLRASCR